MYQCNICGADVKKFFPYKGGTSALSELQRKLDVIGSDVDNFGCPSCGCHDRERHLKLYIEKTGILKGKEGMRILHFAPEKNIINFLVELNPEIYILADLYSIDPRFEKIDIEEIPYSDRTFDLVIANHVLEHVNQPSKAMAEINRVLVDDGIAILQTPFSQFLERTFEDKSIKTPEQRLFFYGQEDHVRTFGLDLFSEMSNYLINKVKQHADIFDSDLVSNYGVNELEPFFLFGKKSLELESVLDLPNKIEQELVSNLEPQVSICCITFNHEKFIEKTIISFLMQKTTIPFEIVVGEDGGCDKTRVIIERLNLQFPGLIRLLPNEPNMGMHLNLIRTLNACKGKYIAICEGDDYWTDSQKLQKQWLYLEAHPECVVTHSGVQGVRDGRVDINYVGGIKQDLTSVQLLTSTPINTLTVMFRNVLLDLPPEIITSGAGDLFIWSLLGHYGSCHYCTDILPSVYNIHDGGVHSKKPMVEKILMRLKTNYSLYMYYVRNKSPVLSDYFLACAESDVKLIKRLPEGGAVTFADIANHMAAIAEGHFDFDSSALSKILTKVDNECSA